MTYNYEKSHTITYNYEPDYVSPAFIPVLKSFKIVKLGKIDDISIVTILLLLMLRTVNLWKKTILRIFFDTESLRWG